MRNSFLYSDYFLGELVMGGRILIADDDIRVNELLQDIFEMEGFEVAAAYDGEQAILALEQDEGIDLLILDVMMPVYDGWEVLEYVRDHFEVPVLMLTALSDESSELRGLRRGADDYVPKPFRRAVLVERARRLIRGRRDTQEKDYVCGGLRLCQSGCRVYAGKKELRLTTKEYQLLLLMMKNHHIVLNRDAILEKVWGIGYDGNDRTIDTHIKMLRHSLGEYGSLIRTIRGVGYSFEGEVEEQ